MQDTTPSPNAVVHVEVHVYLCFASHDDTTLLLRHLCHDMLHDICIPRRPAFRNSVLHRESGYNGPGAQIA